MTSSTPEQRRIELEERLMYQDRLLTQLNEIVTAQQETIERLLRRLDRLEARLAESPREDVNEPPPHY